MRHQATNCDLPPIPDCETMRLPERGYCIPTSARCSIGCRGDYKSQHRYTLVCFRVSDIRPTLTGSWGWGGAGRVFLTSQLTPKSYPNISWNTTLSPKFVETSCSLLLSSTLLWNWFYVNTSSRSLSCYPLVLLDSGLVGLGWFLTATLW